MKNLFMVLVDFDGEGKAIKFTQTKHVYADFKAYLEADNASEICVLLDGLNLKKEIVLGDLQKTDHSFADETYIPKESENCVALYSFDAYALKKALQTGVYAQAIPYLANKFSVNY